MSFIITKLQDNNFYKSEVETCTKNIKNKADKLWKRKT